MFASLLSVVENDNKMRRNLFPRDNLNSLVLEHFLQASFTSAGKFHPSLSYLTLSYWEKEVVSFLSCSRQTCCLMKTHLSVLNLLTIPGILAACCEGGSVPSKSRGLLSYILALKQFFRGFFCLFFAALG